MHEKCGNYSAAGQRAGALEAESWRKCTYRTVRYVRAGVVALG